MYHRLVTYFRRKLNDGSWTYYLRIRQTEAGRSGCRYERIFRTEPEPSKDRRREFSARAKAEALRREEELTGFNNVRGSVRAIDIPLAIRNYISCIEGNARRRPLLSASSCERKARVLSELTAYIGDNFPDTRAVKQISRRHLAAWRDERSGSGMRESTINVEISDVQGWLKWCYDHEYVSEVCSESLRRLEVMRERANPPTTERLAEILRFFDDAPAKRVALVTLATTGLRSAELRTLPRQAFDPINDLLVVPKGDVERTKIHGRTLPIPHRTAAMLRDHMAGRADQSPLLCVATEGKAMSSELNRWLRPHGITPHDLRRWFQTTLESVQAPQYLIDDLMGHKPGRVRMAYSGQMDPEQARPWVEKVESHLFASGD